MFLIFKKIWNMILHDFSNKMHPRLVWFVFSAVLCYKRIKIGLHNKNDKKMIRKWLYLRISTTEKYNYEIWLVLF